jgi:hypothetical protein
MPLLGESASDAVDPATPLDLLRGDHEAEPLLQRTGERAAHRVRLPSGSLDDLGDRRALLAPEHRHKSRLLGAFPGLAASRRCVRRRRPFRLHGILTASPGAASPPVGVLPASMPRAAKAASVATSVVTGPLSPARQLGASGPASTSRTSPRAISAPTSFWAAPPLMRSGRGSTQRLGRWEAAVRITS